MSDPILDEDEINRLLNRPVCTTNIEEIQQGAIQTIYDLYDRKTTREYYGGALTQALILYSQCSKLWMLNSIHTCYHNGELNEHAFDTTYHQMKQLIEAQQGVVSGVLKDLKQCPTSKDKVS